MTRETYMRELAYLLQDIPEEEREEALDFYHSYFDEAGEGQEAAVIEKLGSPEKTAAIIRASLTGDKGEAGEYTEAGYQDQRYREDNKVPDIHRMPPQEKVKSEGYKEYKKPNNNNVILWIVLLILTSPIWLGILGGVGGLLVGLLAGMAAVVVAVAVVTVVFLVIGCILVGVGLVNLFVTPGIGALTGAIGMWMLALGLLGLILCGWVFVKWLPGLVRWVTQILSNLLLNWRGRRNI